MTKKPKPSPPPAQWDIYIAKAKAQLLGTVEAKDAEAAIAEAAKEFEVKEPTGWQGVCLPRQGDKIDRFEKSQLLERETAYRYHAPAAERCEEDHTRTIFCQLQTETVATR